MKKILYLLLLVPLFIISSCEKNTDSSNFEVGDYVEGGVVFFVDSTGQHGLVAAQYDIGKYPWGCFETDIIGANEISIGSGSSNTLSIVENCGYAIVVNFAVAPTGGFAAEFNKYTAYRVRPIRSF